jgi:hypothetical protein
MEHINTLEHYEHLLKSGLAPKEAKAIVLSLNTSFDSVVTKDMLTAELRHLERDLKFFFIKTIGGTLFLLLLAPKLMHILGWS